MSEILSNGRPDDGGFGLVPTYRFSDDGLPDAKRTGEPGEYDVVGPPLFGPEISLLHNTA
jgi:hypothetical protein